MRLTIASVLLSLLCLSPADAGLFDELQPVSTLFRSDSNCTEGNCIQECSCIESCSCACTPAPMMIGDSLGLPHQLIASNGDILIPNYYSKVADNNSAIPQDRVFMNYRFFNDVRTFQSVSPAANEVRDLSILEFGMEKTFFDGMVSADLILPFMNSPVEGLTLAGATPEQEMQLDDIAFGLKGVLLQSDQRTLSSGVRFEAPTGSRLMDTASPGILENDAWAVTPYLAYLNEINDKTFFQTFVAYRMQTTENGDRVVGVPTVNYRQPAYLNIDAQLGRWLFRNNRGRGITGMQALIELHYTSTNKPIQPNGVGNLLVASGGSHDFLNLTTGLTTLVNNNVTLTTAMSFPIRNGSDSDNAGDGSPFTHPSPSDRNYDWELMVQVNYFFNQSWR